MKTSYDIYLILFFLVTSSSIGQINQEINTRSIAQTVLDKGISEIDLGYYPGTLLLHGMSELAMLKDDASELNVEIDLFRKFASGEIKGRGSFISYQYGGSGVPYLVWKGKAKALRGQMQEGAERMYMEQKRSSEGILVPPWVKEGKDQVFIDVAFAVTPYLLYAGLDLKNEHYIETAINETTELFRILEDRKTGLLHQGRGFQGAGKISEDNWSRGNGWGAFALAILVRDLPKSHPKREEVESLAKQFFTSIIDFQNREGLWHQEITDSSSYVETSGSGLILFGIGIMLEAGLLDQALMKNFKLGLRGYASYIGSDGSVSHTCVGCLCPKNGTKEDYKNHPWAYNDEHAFGPVVLAFAQASKMGIQSITPLKKRGLFCIADSPDIPRTYVRKARESDVAWENDRIAYRVFGPSTRAKVGNGIDVWAKSVDYPILDKWYKLNSEGKDYHVDRGEGSDFYNAGKQMGCGGIALWQEGVPYPSETFDSYNIVSNQNDQLAFELNYNTWDTPGLELKEHKRIEMVTGTQLFKVTSTIKSEVDHVITLAIGLTTFGKQKVIQDQENGVLTVWETIDSENGNLGTAVIIDPVQIKGFARNGDNEFVLIQVHTNRPFTYYAGAGWENGTSFKDMESWRNYVYDQSKKIGL